MIAIDLTSSDRPHSDNGESPHLDREGEPAPAASRQEESPGLIEVGEGKPAPAVSGEGEPAPAHSREEQPGSHAANSEEPPPDPDVPDQQEDASWDGIAEALQGLHACVEESQQLLARQIDLADRLHAENQRLRVGELRVALLPLIRDLLRLHDDVGRLIDVAGQESQRDLLVVRDSLLDALARNGVCRFAAEPHTPFDPKQHAAVGIEPTGQHEHDRLIVETLRAGFRWEEGQLVRVADVRVFKYTPADAPAREPAVEAAQPGEAASEIAQSGGPAVETAQPDEAASERSPNPYQT